MESKRYKAWQGSRLEGSPHVSCGSSFLGGTPLPPTENSQLGFFVAVPQKPNPEKGTLKTKPHLHWVEHI